MASHQSIRAKAASDTRVARLTGLMVLAIVVVGGALAGLQYRTSRTIVYRRASLDTETTARAADQLVQNRITILSAIASSPDVAALDRTAMKAHFDQFIATVENSFGSLAWVDQTGKVQVSSEFRIGTRDIDLNDREYVRQVTETKKPYVSEVLASKVDQRPVFIIAIPLSKRAGQSNGILLWGEPLDRLTQNLRSTIGDERTVVIDRKGQILFSPYSKPLSAPSSSFDLGNLTARGTGVRPGATGPDGSPSQLLAYANVPTAGWLIVTSNPLGTALKHARQALFIELAILGLVAVALALFGLRVQRSLRRIDDRRAKAIERSELLREFATRLTPAPTQEAVTNVITSFAAIVTSASVVQIAAPVGYRPGRVEIPQLLPFWSSLSEEENVEWSQLFNEVATPMRDAFLTGSPVIVRHSQDRSAMYPHLSDLSNQAHVVSTASLPLFDSLERSTGSMCFGWNHQQSFDREQMALIDTTSRLCGQALERSALFDREQLARRRAEALQTFTTNVSASTQPKRIVESIASEMLRATRTLRSTLSALDTDGMSLALIASAGYKPKEQQPDWCTTSFGTETLTTNAMRSQQITYEPASGIPHYVAIPLPVELFRPCVVVLEFDPLHQEHYTNFDFDDLARRAAQALDRGHRFDATERSAERARLLALAVSALASAETRADVSQAFAESLPLLFCSEGFLGVIGNDAETLDVLHAPTRTNGFGIESDDGSDDGSDVGSDIGLATEPLTVVLGDTQVGRFLTTNQPHFAADGFVHLLDELVGEGSHVSVEARTLQPRSWVLLPLTNAGRRIGLVGFYYSEAQTFDDEQRIDLTSYSALCANALARAERFELEHEIAVTLQDSLLPAVPSHVGEALLAGRYQPSTRNVSVGGDWFDAIQLSDTRFLLVVGDVVGHGIHSAAAMGKLSTATRALAPLFPEPARLLEKLDEFAALDHDTHFASMALVLVDSSKGTLTCSLAGHPAPLLKSANQSITILNAGRGPALGVTSASRQQRQTLLDGDELIVMYTDGLVERRSDHIDQRLELLRSVISRHYKSVEVLADTLLGAMLEEDHNDDVALLCVQLSTEITSFEKSITGEVGSLHQLRIDLRTWLSLMATSESTIDDVLLASGEAVTNAIEHGHQFELHNIVVRGQRLGGVLTLSVADQGKWKPESADPGNRGRGLAMMRAVMDTVSVRPLDNGTMIEFSKDLSLDKPTDEPEEGSQEKTEP